MKIPFESWLADQALDSDSRSLFGEAILCYRAQAYRAALVFTYLAFLRSLASRLMTSERPSELAVDRWETLQRKLRDDATWEAATFDAAVQSQPAPVFLISDDMRQQLQYWRGRRNDAAHSRGNQLSYAHVEMLWLFVQSNSGRFVVNGGASGLLERFKRHFDPTYTPTDTDSSDLVRQIPQSVPPHELRQFLRELLSIPALNEFDYHIPDLSMSPSEGLISNLDDLGDQGVLDALAAELKPHADLFMAVLLSRPNFILHYSGDVDLLRDLWYDRLPMSNLQYFNALAQSLRVVAAMLRNDLVPRPLHESVMDHVVGRIQEVHPRDDYSPDLLAELEPFGLWAAVRRHAFRSWDPNATKWGADNLEIVLAYLERNEVDADVARFFCDLFPRAIPDWEEYDWFRDTGLSEPEDPVDLSFYFSTHPELYHAIVQVAQKLGLSVEHFATLMAPERVRNRP